MSIRDLTDAHATHNVRDSRCRRRYWRSDCRAFAWHAQGFRVRLFEQAPAFEETGAGLQLSPNASRVLHDLSLEPHLRSTALLPEAIEFRHWKSGRTLATYPLGDEVRETYGFPYYVMLRTDLVARLANAANDDPRIELHTGARVDRVHQSRTSVTATVNGRRYGGSILLGADGIHSTVRAAVFGSETPVYSGEIAWRALVSAADLPEGMMRPVVTVWWGPGRHFVHYFVRENALVNCVGIVTRRNEPESWIEPGDREELRNDFAGWNGDFADADRWCGELPQVGIARPSAHVPLDGTIASRCWATPVMPPCRSWPRAQPWRWKDAAVLARCVAERPDDPNGLARYQSLRYRRTARVQRHSRRNARIFHLSGLSAWLRKPGGRFDRRQDLSRAVRVQRIGAIRNLTGL